MEKSGRYLLCYIRSFVMGSLRYFGYKRRKMKPKSITPNQQKNIQQPGVNRRPKLTHLNSSNKSAT
jgi:hypothetical protein